jgi:hypothetical protein
MAERKNQSSRRSTMPSTKMMRIKPICRSTLVSMVLFGLLFMVKPLGDEIRVFV